MNAADPQRVRSTTEEIGVDLPPRARSIGVVAWCSFLAASAGTAVTFAFVDPGALPAVLLPPVLSNPLAVYALGFFFLWAVCAAASALTIYMAHTERPTSNSPP
jgi:hypothetical protein